MVVDPDGNEWVRVEEICYLGAACPHSRHRYDAPDAQPTAILGRDITCKTVRSWARNPTRRTVAVRVGRATWYRLDQLRTDEADTREPKRADGMPKRPRKPNRRQT